MPEVFNVDFQSGYTVPGALNGQDGWTTDHADWKTRDSGGGDNVARKVVSATTTPMNAYRAVTGAPLTRSPWWRIAYNVAHAADDDETHVYLAATTVANHYLDIKHESSGGDLTITFDTSTVTSTVTGGTGSWVAVAVLCNFYDGWGRAWVNGAEVGYFPILTTTWANFTAPHYLKLRTVRVGAAYQGNLDFDDLVVTYGAQLAWTAPDGAVISDVLTEHECAPFGALDLDVDDPVDGASTRYYSDRTRPVFDASGVTLDRLYRGRVLSWGPLTQRVQLQGGGLSNEYIDVVLRRQSAQREGDSTVGDDELTPVADALPGPGAYQDAVVQLAAEGADLGDWRQIFAGVATPGAMLSRDALVLRIENKIASKLRETSQSVGAITSSQFSGAPTSSLGKPAPIIYGTLAKTGFGRIPLIPLTTADGASAVDLMVAGHYLTAAGSTSLGVDAVYHLDSSAGTLTALTVTTQWTASVVTGGSPIATYTKITIDSGVGANVDDLFFADVLGMDDAGDTTGATLGDGTGALLDNPSAVLTSYLLNFGGFAAADLDATTNAATLSTLDGWSYLAAGYIGDYERVGETMRKIADSFNLRFHVTDDSSTSARVLGWTVFNLSWGSVAAARKYRDKIEIGGITWERDESMLTTEILPAWAKDYARDTYDETTAISGAALNGVHKQRRVRADWLHDSTTADDVWGRRLFQFQSPPLIARFTAPLKAELDEPRAIVKVSSRYALSAEESATDRLMEVFEHTLDLDRCTVRVVARDVSDSWGATGVLGEDAPGGDSDTTDTHASLIRVTQGTVTASVTNGSSTVTFSSSITAKSGDILVLPSPTNSGNRVRRALQGGTDTLGTESTRTTWTMLDAWGGSGDTTWTTEAGMACRVEQSYATASVEDRAHYWFLGDSSTPTNAFANGDAIKRLF